MSILKKFLVIFCITTMLIFCGCGSDKSNKKESEPLPPKQETSQRVENPSSIPRSDVNLYSNNLGMTQENFISSYNLALSHLENQSGSNYDNLKITSATRINEVKTKSMYSVEIRRNWDGTITLYRGLSSNYIFAVKITSSGSTNLTEILPDVIASLFAVANDKGDYSDIVTVVDNLIKLIEKDLHAGKAYPSFSVVIDGLGIYCSRDTLLLISEDNSLVDTVIRRDMFTRLDSRKFRPNISPSLTGKDTMPTTKTTTLTPSNLSVGGINTGASVNQMHKVLGKEKEIRKSQNTPGNSYYEYNDVVVCVNRDKVISVATYTNVPQTEKGIRQGDSLKKVLSTYGRVCSVEHFDDLTLYEYPFELERGNYSIMRFAIKNDTVEYVSLRIVDSNEFNKISSAKQTL